MLMKTKNTTTLVIGATGVVGQHVVNGLLKLSIPVRCMTRVASNISNFPPGVDGYVADLLKPGSLRAAFKNVKKVFLVSPLSQYETEEGLAAVQFAISAKVEKIVYMSVPMPIASKHIPHYLSKIPIEQAIDQSGLTYTILRPNNLYQNDYWARAGVMTYNTYPQPIGSVGLNRVDARDVADAAVNALNLSMHDNQEYFLHGPNTLTGPMVAQIFGKYLNRNIGYGGDDLDAWAKQAQHMMPAWMVQDLRLMYAYFQKHGLIATPEALLQQDAVIGHPPRPYPEFVKEIIQQWQHVS